MINVSKNPVTKAKNNDQALTLNINNSNASETIITQNAIRLGLIKGSNPSFIIANIAEILAGRGERLVCLKK